MKTLALALAATLIGSAAFADETTVTRTETPFSSSTTVKKRTDDDVVVRQRTIDTTGTLGCETKSVTKTDEDEGETTTRTKTRC